jgi:hypothetical protein
MDENQRAAFSGLLEIKSYSVVRGRIGHFRRSCFGR